MTDESILTTYQMPKPEIMSPVRRIAGYIAKAQRRSPTCVFLHVKEWQRYRGLSNAEAAARIGVSPISYRNWSDNRHWPSAVHLPQMAEAFDCTIEELFFPPPGMKQ